MKIVKYIIQGLITSAICLGITGGLEDLAQAQQRPNFLFSNCVTKGNSGTSRNEVSIGRELFTSVYYIREITLVTCRIRPAGSSAKFKTLRLAFGVSDNSNEGTKPLDVNIYLDGNLAESRNLGVGEKSLVLIDVSKASSVAIEIPSNNDTASWAYLSVTQALLEPISRPSSGSRK